MVRRRQPFFVAERETSTCLLLVFCQSPEASIILTFDPPDWWMRLKVEADMIQNGNSRKDSMYLSHIVVHAVLT